MSKTKYKVTVSMILPEEVHYIYADSSDEVRRRVETLALDQGLSEYKIKGIVQLPVSERSRSNG